MLKRSALTLALFSLTLLAVSAFGQSTATLEGTITDASGLVVSNAQISVLNVDTGVERKIASDDSGNYSAPSLPPGKYRVTVEAKGMGKVVADGVVLSVSHTTPQNFSLKVASATETVSITAEAPVIESATMTVGAVVDQKTVQEIPLNGRHFVDLASLAPGTVVPPANGNLTTPLRGQGAFAIVTAGGREDTTNFMINGVNLNDMANAQINFQPTINTVSEFKIDNSTYSAENGRNSGAIVNIATRSGSNAFHGEAFEFVRNMDFDARNFFNKANDPLTGAPAPVNAFKRNNFGAAIGGPIWKDHTFFFGSYEGLRQRQGLALSSVVPSDAQRNAVTDPTTKKLLALLPHGSGGDLTSAASFLGSAVAPVNIDQGTGDVSHNFNQNDRLHGYYVFQRDQRLEPNNSGATVPGGGDTRQSHRQIFTLSETHIFNSALVNDLRLGFNRIHILFTSDVQNAGLDPTAFGINDGLSGPIGIPHITVTGVMQFGGEGNFPQGRGDLTSVLSDSLNYLHGNHSFKLGGEYRRFNGNNFAADEGLITFSNLAHFLSAQPTGFSINGGGNHPARTTQQAVGLFGMDSYKVKPYLTLELGLRWEWNFTPTEAMNRSTIFNLQQDTLTQIGNGIDEYHQNNKLFQPRVGVAWDLFHDGKTVLRSGYGIMYDQPLPIISNGNPPFGKPVTYTSSTAKPNSTYATLQTDAAGGGLTPATADPNYNDAYVQSWNLNLQKELAPSLGMMIGYFGSKGTHLNRQINLNQITPAGRPFPRLSLSSPILPNSLLGNITSNESTGTSHYNALWLTATKHMGHGLQFDTNYTWSKSIDYNSRNFQGITVQDSLNPAGDRGLSDFDARHHLTFSGIYELPFQRNRLTSGWRLSSIFTVQSGNPLNIISGSSTLTGSGAIGGLTGVATIRPDLVGALPSVGATVITTPGDANAGKVQWFPGVAITCDPSNPPTPPKQPSIGCLNPVFFIPATKTGATSAAYHFGNLGRNALTGPGYQDLDFSIAKSTKITERLSHEFRVEIFDLLNHPNFSNPGLIAQPVLPNSTPTFGIISATRNPTGDAGSSRQLQLSMKLIF